MPGGGRGFLLPPRFKIAVIFKTDELFFENHKVWERKGFKLYVYINPLDKINRPLLPKRLYCIMNIMV